MTSASPSTTKTLQHKSPLTFDIIFYPPVKYKPRGYVLFSSPKFFSATAYVNHAKSDYVTLPLASLALVNSILASTRDILISHIALTNRDVLPWRWMYFQMCEEVRMLSGEGKKKHMWLGNTVGSSKGLNIESCYYEVIIVKIGYDFSFRLLYTKTNIPLCFE